MSRSKQELPAPQHPAWFVRSVAVGFPAVYACSLVAANVYPHGDQQHGWPFVYMVRLSRVPGPLPNILYGPWPFFNPPIVQFQPALLLVNIFCAGLLVTMATAVPVYWLRRSVSRFQFGLRSLLVLTAVVACAFSLLKWFSLHANYSWMAAVVLIVASRFLVAFFPALMVLTFAHWLVLRATEAGRSGRWMGLHWLTWLAICVVGGPCLHYGIVAVVDCRTGWPWAQKTYDSWTPPCWPKAAPWNTIYQGHGATRT